MVYTHLGEMFDLLPIYGASLLLGLVSGITAVHLLTTRMGRLSLRAMTGVVALAASLSCLVAAKPAFWLPTVELWAMAAVVTAVLDLSVSYLVEPWRATGRFSQGALRRMRVWLPPAIVGAVAGTLWVLKLRFDIPLNLKLMPSFATSLVATLFALGAIDFAARLTVIGLGRRWRKWSAGPSRSS